MTRTQLIIILIAVGFSFLSWLIGKIREQAEINRVQRERIRRREEELRTGRPQPEPQQSVVRMPAELQTLAERRQQQLRALREQQMQRMRGQQAGRSPAQTPQASPAPARPTSQQTPAWGAQRGPTQHEMRSPTPMRAPTLKSSHPQTPHQSQSAGRESMRTPTPMQSRTLRAPTAQPPPTPPRQPERTRSTQPTQRQTPARRPPMREVQAPARLATPARPPSAYDIAVREQRPSLRRQAEEAPMMLAGSMALELRNMSQEEWRRAIVLRELLNPPITERGPESQPGVSY